MTLSAVMSAAWVSSDAFVVDQVLGHEDRQRQREEPDGEDRGHDHDGNDLPAHPLHLPTGNLTVGGTGFRSGMAAASDTACR